MQLASASPINLRGDILSFSMFQSLVMNNGWINKNYILYEVINDIIVV